MKHKYQQQQQQHNQAIIIIIFTYFYLQQFFRFYTMQYKSRNNELKFLTLVG